MLQEGIWNISTFRKFRKNALMHRPVARDRPWITPSLRIWYTEK